MSAETHLASEVKSFVEYLNQCIQNRDVTEIRMLYEVEFNSLTERYLEHTCICMVDRFVGAALNVRMFCFEHRQLRPSPTYTPVHTYSIY